MNKTIERLITAGMIAVLTTAFFQVAHATNESSYKRGYYFGILNYKYGSNPDVRYPSRDRMDSNCSVATNVTACRDGFYNAFIDWCHSNEKTCREDVLGMGIAPRSSVDQHLNPYSGN